MPKKPTKEDTKKDETKKVDENTTEKPTAKGGHTFLKVDKSHRPAGFHCDELNTSYDQYDTK
jgi:hypothetical protein